MPANNVEAYENQNETKIANTIERDSLQRMLNETISQFIAKYKKMKRKNKKNSVRTYSKSRQTGNHCNSYNSAAFDFQSLEIFYLI